MLGTARAERLLARLAPAIETEGRPRLTVQITGTSEIAVAARAVLEADGHRCRMRAPDLAVAVAEWRVPEATRQRLLHADRPHLPVTIGDQRIDVGPFTIPGVSACVRCARLADRDAFVPVRLPSIESVPAVAIAQSAAMIAVLVGRAAAGTLPGGTGVRIAARTGIATDATWSVHPACGCVRLPVPIRP